jgi:hypothetical protein
MMSRILTSISLPLFVSTVFVRAAAEDSVPLRPPAVPLVASDPYFSVWSPTDKLNESSTVHWTGKSHRLTSLVRIDGKVFRLMGRDPKDVPPLAQTGLDVFPTRTRYTFAGAGVQLRLTFMTPALPEDLMVYARPVTYLTWEAKALDARKHELEVYFDASGELTVNEPAQLVQGSMERVGRLEALKMGSQDQPVLSKKGDDLRIDWGYLYVAAKQAEWVGFGAPEMQRQKFISGSKGNAAAVVGEPKRADSIVASLALKLGKIGTRETSKWLVLAYDDEYSIQYFKRNLRPYWRRNGDDAATLLEKSIAEYQELSKKCEVFDTELLADLRRIGGEKYARLCALTYRQCVAGTKLVADSKGQPLLFPKENTSNGCIGTVDVIYPMAPQFLLFGRSLAKAMLVSNLDYASSPRWKWPFAPHDLGTYPLANGQVYGGGERTEEDQMPVEETGNMLILVAAVAQMEENADFVSKYWPVLTKWAEYLKDKGFDPENQLCTDDFMGHLAHNVNLSVKATLGIASFAYLCELRGDRDSAGKYRQLAQDFAKRWVSAADDGDHFRLAFDKTGTWSQKYNLVWDKILGFGLYPDSVRRKEMDYYLKVEKTYGVPLDNRGDGAKLDWSLWTATLTQNSHDFAAVMDPVFKFLNETPERVGAGDFYNTATGHHIGMHSRPVVGGVFLPVLYDHVLWKKWWDRDTAKTADWAPLPTAPKIVTVLPAADQQSATWRYVTAPPASGWMGMGFDDSTWQSGKSGFGTKNTPGALVGTIWNTDDIWLRREVNLAPTTWHDLECWLHHDEDAEVFINGALAVKTKGYTTTYETFPLLPAAKAAVKSGKNVIAIHCHQTTGGQYIDLGLADVQFQ